MGAESELSNKNKEKILEKTKSSNNFLSTKYLNEFQEILINILNKYFDIYSKKTILFFDDFYQIKQINQPYILEFSHKDDYSTINVDHNLDDLDRQKRYLLDIVSNIHNDVNLTTDKIKQLFNKDDILDTSVLATGGLPRDFMILFSNAITIARKSEKKKIYAEHIYMAINDFSKDKDINLEIDTEIGKELMQNAISQIQLDIVGELKTNVILYPYEHYKRDESLLKSLENVRYIHLISKSVSKKSDKHIKYYAYLIDMSFCILERQKKKNFNFNEFWKKDKARTLNNLRSADVWSFDIKKLEKTS